MGINGPEGQIADYAARPMRSDHRSTGQTLLLVLLGFVAGFELGGAVNLFRDVPDMVLALRKPKVVTVERVAYRYPVIAYLEPGFDEVLIEGCSLSAAPQTKANGCAAGCASFTATEALPVVAVPARRERRPHWDGDGPDAAAAALPGG